MTLWLVVISVVVGTIALGWWTSGRDSGRGVPGADYDAMKAQVERGMVERRMKGGGGVGGL